MTRDEIRGLLGGYATGSLTESERKLLFEAALEDQDLFEQLVREHALKELIDLPGARDRLIAALAPEPSRIGGWKKPLAWGLAAMFVVSMSVAALMLTRSGIRTQMAQTPTAQLSQPPAQPAGSGIPPPAADQVRDQPASEKGPVARAKPGALAKKAQTEEGGLQKQGAKEAFTRNGLAEDSRLDRLEPVQPVNKDGRAGSGASSNGALRTASASPASPISPAPPPRPPANGQGQSTGQISPPPVVQPQQSVAGSVASGQVPPGQTPQAPRAQQAPQIASGQAPGSQAQNSQRQSGQEAKAQVQTEQSRLQVPTGQNQVQARGGGGGARGAGVAGAIGGRVERAAKSAPAPFAFDYAIDGEDLVFKFAADGYFSLHIAPGGLTIVDSRVTAGSTRREHITANGTEATIVFSASRQSYDQGVSIETRARSGTVDDPARKRIDLLIKFY